MRSTPNDLIYYLLIGQGGVREAKTIGTMPGDWVEPKPLHLEGQLAKKGIFTNGQLAKKGIFTNGQLAKKGIFTNGQFNF